MSQKPSCEGMTPAVKPMSLHFDVSYTPVKFCNCRLQGCDKICLHTHKHLPKYSKLPLCLFQSHCVSRTIFCHDGRKNKCACTQMVITFILMLLRLLLHMESCSKSLKESRIGGWSMGLIVSWPSDFSPIYCVKYSWVTSIFRHINFFQSTQNHLCGSCCSSKWKTHARKTETDRERDKEIQMILTKTQPAGNKEK